VLEGAVEDKENNELEYSSTHDTGQDRVAVVIN
jgi:hypothetical protein